MDTVDDLTNATENVSAAPEKKRFKRGMKVAVGVAAVLGLTLGSSMVAYGVYYEDRVLPAVTLQGKDISGMKQAEVEKLIADTSAGKELVFEVGSEKIQAKYEELGITTDVAATVDSVFSANQTLWNRFIAYFAPRDLMIVKKVDEAKLNQFADGLEEKLAKPRQNAKLEYDAEVGEFKAIPGVTGEVVDKADLLTQVKAKLATLDEAPVKAKIVSQEPDVTDEQVNAYKTKAVELANLKLAFFEGNYDIEVPVAKKATLLSFTDADGKTVEPHYDEAKVHKYVMDLSVETNSLPEPALHNVNSKGAVVQVATEGKPGWNVNNAEAVANQTVEALKAGKEFRGEFTYDKVPQPVETRLIADGAEGLAYQAAPGERWIDINLSNLTMTAYEGSTPVYHTNQIVPGAPETPTITGKFAVYLKYNVQDMRGTNIDGSPYLTKGVPWVTYFHGGYAIHGAPWRAYFGLGHSAGGSHGCVNTPSVHAKFIYDWSQMGDPVVVHY
ncbi:L,D-transpeptidase/peptidoglycan binding protein [Gleimia sp. 6138-11-ORH1]|uniref:L,D-transpeptidase family protein n=1 Tax=Gleimia sp. 6138-11-ORH1 TaxID=2973937 RepID=UPI00216A9E95|nr:L,D-transpeptidase family protein [Gleimia sp. 6138-11-ORH1]MCS4483884.1 L,D-transpeptidase/peptidoglycan binding protein [Gleimia sp. 6138-11-ORH1]